MSGHSKWANIKRKKGKNDAIRGKITTKIGREITIAVRMGGPDPVGNMRLKLALQKAKENNIPKDNIKRAIQKGAGATEGQNYEEIVYEGFGPCGVSVIVEALTDNKNRAAADVRCIFSKSGGNLGQSGSVGYMFNKKGYILLEKSENFDEDSFMLDALDHGAEDINSEEEYVEIFCNPSDFSSLLEFVQGLGVTILESDIRQIATIKKELNDEEEEKFQRFLDKLDDCDDVQNVWHNADI